jgi:hypothetical protein
MFIKHRTQGEMPAVRGRGAHSLRKQTETGISPVPLMVSRFHIEKLF